MSRYAQCMQHACVILPRPQFLKQSELIANDLAWFQLKLWALSLLAQSPNRDLGGNCLQALADWMSHAGAQACLRAIAQILGTIGLSTIHTL